MAQTWYEGLEMEGNTSINPFFYGTYLAETKPNEPVTRTKKQAFQADAVGVAHQLTPAHFEKPHTFRLEWQPGPGGRLDWFVKGKRYNETEVYVDDGTGQEWIHALSLKDESLSDLMGSQIPIEPTYLIFNTAVSSTWGFPYDSPDWCPNCYDCDDPKCACRFYPGFCQMIRSGKTAMYIDFVRIYQSSNADAHVGANHSLGCDPPEYPTREWIKGHEYKYMRNPPFSYADKHPLRPVQRGGASCVDHGDCGGSVKRRNLTAVYNSDSNGEKGGARGECLSAIGAGLMFSAGSVTGKLCVCKPGFTGPNCLAQSHVDTSPSAYVIRMGESPFKRIESIVMPGFLSAMVVVFGIVLIIMLMFRVRHEKLDRLHGKATWKRNAYGGMSPVSNRPGSSV